jgi:protein disulfide-isomerase
MFCIEIFVLLFIGLFIGSISCKTAVPQGDELNWSEDYRAAVSLAQETNKPILINFTGSDWCGWCWKLSEEVFSQPEFKEYAEGNLILFKADFPRDIIQSDELKTQNRALAEKHEIEGFPTIVLLDKDENVLGVTGYKSGGAKAYIEHLEEMVK